jgi:hypothetical protein
MGTVFAVVCIFLTNFANSSTLNDLGLAFWSGWVNLFIRVFLIERYGYNQPAANRGELQM